MTVAEIVAASGHRCRLGEGSHWDGTAVVHVDGVAGRVHRWTPGTDRLETLEVGGAVGFALPAGTGWLLAREQEILAVDADGGRRVLATVETGRDTRVNDAKIGPDGRLYFGTLSRARRPECALYRMAPDGTVTELAGGITVSNGLAWDEPRQRLYHVETATGRIDMLDPDGTGRRPFVTVDPHHGVPDGLATDVDGGVWVALYGGGALHRHGPDGELTEIVELPVTNPTSVAFGGPDLTTLYVTTATHGLPKDRLADEPLAGAVLVLDAPVPGVPVPAPTF